MPDDVNVEDADDVAVCELVLLDVDVWLDVTVGVCEPVLVADGV